MSEVRVSAVANPNRTTYRVSTAVGEDWHNVFFSWDGAPLTDWTWAFRAVTASYWVEPRTTFDLDLLQEGQMTFCTDTGEAWIRSGGNLLQIATNG